MELIETILRLLFPERATQIRISAVRTETLGRLVAPIMFESNGYEITALLPYKEPMVSALMVEAKFHEHARAHVLLGTLLAEYLRDFIEEMAFDARSVILVPVPLSKKRLTERGYNQTQKIISVALRELPFLETRSVLIRTRDTVPQMTLSRAKRLHNLDGAFALSEGPLDPEPIYVLVDDVTTTGATLVQTAKTLRNGGARNLHVLALAH